MYDLHEMYNFWIAHTLDLILTVALGFWILGTLSNLHNVHKFKGIAVNFLYCNTLVLGH